MHSNGNYFPLCSSLCSVAKKLTYEVDEVGLVDSEAFSASFLLVGLLEGLIELEGDRVTAVARHRVGQQRRAFLLLGQRGRRESHALGPGGQRRLLLKVLVVRVVHEGLLGRVLRVKGRQLGVDGLIFDFILM